MKNWQKELTKNISNLDQLSEVLHIDKDELEGIVERHPMNIPEYYLNLIDKDDPNDPIRLMCVPSVAELDDSAGVYDTSGEESNTVLGGLQHKYQQTALVLSTNICYMYCRHCFRKRLVGYTQEEIMNTLHEAVEYIQAHPEIDNVLISGGDPLTLSNENIERYLEALSQIEHLDYIRLGSRVPVVLPMRISEDPELIEILQKYNKKKRIILVSHFNHPNELTEEAREAIHVLKDANIDIFNQTVLLKGVNDSVETLSKLMKMLMQNRVTAYYIFQCRPVKYVTNHFQVSIEDGVELVNAVRHTLSGPSKRFRYAMSHPRGKIEILGKIDDQVVFKFAQAKDDQDANVMFMRKMNGEGWLDADLNPTDV